MNIGTCINEYRSRVRAMALVLPIALVCTGCPPKGNPATTSTDGVRCDAADAKDAVYLDVTYDAGGMPAVEPATCEIDRGTRITWRGPSGAQVPFEIRFKGASPVPGERGQFPSRIDGEHQKVSRSLDAPAGRYDYGVFANGKELDPAIIIR